MQKQIKIESCEIKKQGTNEKTGKPWVLYIVKCSGDDEMNEFSTFNGDFMNADGQTAQVNVAYNQKYSNWQETSEKQEAESDKHEEILNGLRKLYERLDEVEKKLFKSITNKQIAEGDDKVFEDEEQ